MSFNFSRDRVYAQSARFDVAKPLTEDELRKLAPSIFAETAHESRSERFRAIPTIEVLRGLENEGFFAVGAKQSVTRDPGKKDFTKHVIRLRRFDDEAKSLRVGDNVLEQYLKNANDGSAAYELMAGMFRIQCMNSLVAQTSTIDSVKVRHSGHAVDNVIEGTFRVLESSKALLAAPQDWSQIQLDRDEAQAFANAAHVLRFADAEGKVSTPVDPAQLLIPRRPADTGKDHWTVFNVVQENAIRGGLTGIREGYREENGNWRAARRVTTRAVNGVDQDIRLNKSLWVLAEEMAKLKKAA